MKNVICVDFTILDLAQLEVFCDEHNFSLEVLTDLKSKGYWKVWFMQDGLGISYNLTKGNRFGITDYEKVRYFPDFLTELTKMQAYQPAQVEKVFSVDVILEKISKNGIQSITKEEKDFLDNL